MSNIQCLLGCILLDRFKEINSIRHKGKPYLLNEENIQTAIQKFKNVKYEGLLKTNEEINDLLALDTALEKAIDRNSKNITLQYDDCRTL